MAIDWEAYDKTVDHEALAKDVENVEQGNGNFEEVPVGQYEVKITKLELSQSKKGAPMMVCWFKILAGEHKGQMIFYYQVVEHRIAIHKALDFLRSLGSNLDIQWTKNYGKLADLILEVYEIIDREKLEYALDYRENEKGYKEFKILEVFQG